MSNGKDVYYFSHDCNARNDEKILMLRAEHGWEGYGLFWALVEMMFESKETCLHHSKIKGIAVSYNIDITLLQSVINTAISEGLFVSDGETFWSESLRRRKAAFHELKEKRSKAGKKGMESRWGKPKNTEPDNSVITKNNKGKESKGKEMKENNIYKDIFDYWISLGIINHQKLNDKMRNKIKAKLNQGYTSEYIKQTMKNYSDILNSDLHYFSHKWSLDNFLQRGFEQFEDREAAWQNFIDKKKNVNEKRQKDQETINYFLKGDKGDETERHS